MNATRCFVFAVLVTLTLAVQPAAAVWPHPDEGTIEDLLDLGVRPFAIGHRGFGDNTGEDPSRPIENTVESVRRGFEAGVSVVEVDVQLTRDGEIVVFHDDFLSDFTCINQLSLAELRARLPFVPRLGGVLDVAKGFNRASGPLSGLVMVELKAAAPLCDPGDTQELAIVSGVISVIRQARMTDQVMLTSFSPVLLALARREAPEIARDLSISGLQFLTQSEVEAALGLPVTVIKKRLNVGELRWADVGPVYRLPGYRSVDEVLMTAAAVGARVVEADLLFLQTGGAPFVDLLHAFGLRALGFTATDPAEWDFLDSLGLDGIYTSDIPFGVAHQALIP